MTEARVRIIPHEFDIPCDMPVCGRPSRHALTRQSGEEPSHPLLFHKLCDKCLEELVDFVRENYLSHVTQAAPAEASAEDAEPNTETPKVLRFIDVADVPDELVKGLFGENVEIPEGGKIGLTLWGPSIQEQLPEALAEETAEDPSESETLEPVKVIVTEIEEGAEKYVCPTCGRDDFISVAQLNGHKRWCKGE